MVRGKVFRRCVAEEATRVVTRAYAVLTRWLQMVTDGYAVVTEVVTRWLRGGYAVVTGGCIVVRGG